MKYTPTAARSKPDKSEASAKPALAKSGKVVGRKTVPPGEIRIIGGQYKRSILPVADRPGLRPTPGRVRETLFNWLGQDLSGWRCADVFAGTGALGFEAASRGAAEVLLCDQDPLLVDKLKALQAKLGATMVKVERGDGLGLLRRLSPDSMQLLFIDPPFDSATLFEPALKAASQAIAGNGFIYLEAPRTWTDEELEPLGLKVHRSGRAGAVHFHLLVRLAFSID
ncbi:MAG: 16S rRNA (guanine(966)-N(2))-methyltransferase RsmD [Comamonadaceae bacterium]|nr:MAG: 16S rRNA (guanine(966)-N(2))-methyltransferase RsmD [Comamonadaceae bacterium]